MPASTYRHTGNHVPVASASGALTGGTLVHQEGIFGVVITGVASGKPTELDVAGVHNIAVPASTVKGDVLWADLSGGDATSVTLVRSGMTTGMTCIGEALSARDSAGKALVKLAPQPSDVYLASATLSELATLAGAIPLAAEADIATADATDLASAQALANATKTKVNALLAKLRTAGILAS